jgi:tetratricopeptide (TPR) repeat protein
MATISWTDASNQARQYIWPMAVSGALERPIYGWGEENFNYIFNADYNPAMYSQEQWFDRAHSVFLDWLVASGFVGLISYLSLYVLFLIAVARSAVGIKQKCVLVALVAGYFVHNIFVFDNLASYVLFFASLGLVDSLYGRRSLEWFGLAARSKPVRADAVEYIVSPVVIAALVFALYFYNIRPVKANLDLIKGIRDCSAKPSAANFNKALGVKTYVANQEIREQILTCAAQVIRGQNVDAGTKQSFFILASKAIHDQETATPKDARIYTLAGSLMNGIGQASEAQDLLQKAHGLSPKKQSIDFELGTSYLNNGQSEKAVALLATAYRSAPEYDQAKLTYASALVADGKEDEARKEFKDDPAIFESAQMADVYVSLKQYEKAIAVYKKISEANPTDVDTRAQLARVQYLGGKIADATATLKSIEKDHPEYASQIEQAIKSMEKEKK